MDKKRLPARSSVVEGVLRLVMRLLALIGVLIVGYSILPLIKLTFKIPIFGTAISLGVIIFVIIASFFSLAIIRFITSATALIGLSSDSLAKFMPNLASKQLSPLRKLLLNFCFLILIVIAYWVVSPFIIFIPSIGSILNATLRIVVIATIVLFFWSMGGTVYRMVEVAIGKILVKSEGWRETVGKVEGKVLKTIVYFLALISVVIISYALIPLIGFSFRIFIPFISISLGIIIFIVILGILSFISVRFIINVASLLGLTSDTLSKFMPSMASANTQSTLRRISVDFCFLIFVLITYWVVYHFMTLIPRTGVILANTAQVVVAAIVIIFFWDIGRTIYKKLEEITLKITSNSNQ